MSFLAILWFGLSALLFAIYAALDGFDLGAGIIYGFTRDPERKRVVIGSISPVWTGNEVWLLAAIGSLLATFPAVYSALLSSLYVPVILVLMTLVIRAGGIELRTKTTLPWLGRVFDLAIVVGSLIPAWAIGLVAGNLLEAMPLDAEGAVSGSWLFFLRPWALLAGLLSLAAFTLHGSLYVAMKTEGAWRERASKAAMRVFFGFAAILLLVAATSPLAIADRFTASKALAGFWLFSALGVLSWAAVFFDLRGGRPGGAFAASTMGIVSFVGASACLLFPTLIPSSLGPAADLTVMNAASADKSLLVVLVLALVALPLIAVYTFVAYRSFRGPSRPAAY